MIPAETMTLKAVRERVAEDYRSVPWPDTGQRQRDAEFLIALLADSGRPPEPQPDFWRCKACGCLWRDNHDDISVSLGSAKQAPCQECEMKGVYETCEPLYRSPIGPPEPRAGGQEAEKAFTLADLRVIASVFTDKAQEKAESEDPDSRAEAPMMSAIAKKAAIAASAGAGSPAAAPTKEPEDGISDAEALHIANLEAQVVDSDVDRWVMIRAVLQEKTLDDCAKLAAISAICNSREPLGEAEIQRTRKLFPHEQADPPPQR